MKLIYRCICTVLGAILGSACSDSRDPVEYGPVPLYGMPLGTVRIEGQVSDEGGNPVPGIRVEFPGSPPDTTDAAGAWSIDDASASVGCAESASNPCTVTGTDIDGPANGGPYLPSTVKLDLVQTEPGDGDWDLGTWEQHGIDIVMVDEAVEYGPPPATVADEDDPAAPER